MTEGGSTSSGERDTNPLVAGAVRTDLAADLSRRDFGYFHDLASAAGGDATTAPVLRADAAPPASLVGLVLDRYAEALAVSRAA